MGLPSNAKERIQSLVVDRIVCKTTLKADGTLNAPFDDLTHNKQPGAGDAYKTSNGSIEIDSGIGAGFFVMPLVALLDPADQYLDIKPFETSGGNWAVRIDVVDANDSQIDPGTESNVFVMFWDMTNGGLKSGSEI